MQVPRKLVIDPTEVEELDSNAVSISSNSGW